MSRRVVVAACALLVAPVLLAAQADPRARLESRGLPADLVTQVTQIAADATRQGLPAEPLVDKAIEGFAKHVPTPRIAAALQQFTVRMADGRGAIQGAGVGTPNGAQVAAAAEALGRGLAPGQVGTLVHAARGPAMVAPGLTVAAALAAQGMQADQAVAVVADAMRQGRTETQILDLPSAARAMQSGGMSSDEVGRRLMHGEGPDGGSGRSDGGRGPGGSGGSGSGGGGGDGRSGGGSGSSGGPGPGGMPGGGGPPPPRPPDGGDRSGHGGRPPRP